MSSTVAKFTFPLWVCGLFMLAAHTVHACSSRTVPKPRPSTSSSASSSILATAPTVTSTAAPTTIGSTTTSTTTQRPNITFPTYKCPETYDAWYCLNEATCFSVKIGDSIMYNCECALGFMGPRCEYKELDASYLPKRPRPLLEASIARGAACAILFMLFVCLTLYLRYDQKPKSIEDEDCYDEGRDVDVCHSYRREQRCCCCADNSKDTDFLVTDAKYQHSAFFRQHFATLPIMSFAFKRSTKL